MLAKKSCKPLLTTLHSQCLLVQAKLSAYRILMCWANPGTTQLSQFRLQWHAVPGYCQQVQLPLLLMIDFLLFVLVMSYFLIVMH